ncbi:MAG: carboxypeptidase-like regulatory domain-containing protein [Planctomycetota bacterium]|nr:carboxypeptidase-like regulatory domain-containing protein [Planctomycetota bacterium]
MARSSHRTLLLVVLALVVGVGGLILLLRHGDGRADVETLVLLEEGMPDPSATLTRPVELVPPVRVAMDADWAEESTVLWPMRVELSLRRAAYLPSADKVPPIRSGKKAQLSGHIADASNRGVRAEIHFVAGPNKGRVLYCDATGRFGASDLYPGLDIVEVRGPGILGSRREVRLRQHSVTLLNLGYGMPGAVSGRIVDRAGEPIHGAKINVDGQIAWTGEDGGFHFARVAGGRSCLVEVDHPDYVALVTEVNVPLRRAIQAKELVLELHPGTSLSLSTPSPVGGPGPTLVFLRPANPQSSRTRTPTPMARTRRFPWHRLNPIEVYPGSPTVIEGLPAEVVRVQAFRPGAISRGEVVNLRLGRTTPVQIRLVDAPKVSGMVTYDGRPVAGATVTLEAPDQVRSYLGFERQQSLYLESEVMPYLPPVRQETRTNAEGRYVLTAWADVAPVRYLEAIGPTGDTWAGRLVRKDDAHVDLELERVDLGDSELVIEFPDRYQGLPIELLINGEPRDPYTLPPFSDLELTALLSGTWSLQVSWHGDDLYVKDELELSGSEKLRIELPEEAIVGQDKEQWRRAGRRYPFPSSD